MSGVTKTAWDVMSGVTKTAWDVLSWVAKNGMGCFVRLPTGADPGFLEGVQINYLQRGFDLIIVSDFY